ncbi:hypothetical protein GEU84_009950 [Fertoebacter nigrum]|uniref:Lipoprotein n=1 Tax=Fertoeibacter niger TaxID=2656921 RepID=A0A8X8KN73_9RHOB|nr:hypothetical protein [Fertoeibacter niger]NUB44705.1 hypothetical protein [Fertoeibacter niger]
MHRPLLAILALALAACGTPQENCIRRETRDLRVVEDLIVTTQDNLRRGYALEEITRTRPVWEECYRPAPSPTPGAAPELKPSLCLEEETYTVTRPKAIDLNAEARTLDSLKAKRSALLRQAEGSIAQCRAQYPE